MCRRINCFYANGCTDTVGHCTFYPTLKDLPKDCQIPEIMKDLSARTNDDTIIELTEEVIIK